jgi:hypothetical protein
MGIVSTSRPPCWASQIKGSNEEYTVYTSIPPNAPGFSIETPNVSISTPSIFVDNRDIGIDPATNH